MKSMATFALIALLCVPARAQFGGMGGGGTATQARSIELELLEMEQEADKAALKEAFLLQARQGMQPNPRYRSRETAVRRGRRCPA